jgi:hypothetical protein
MIDVGTNPVNPEIDNVISSNQDVYNETYLMRNPN